MEPLEIYRDAIIELGKAEEKHPGWPRDVVHAAAIAAEESGSMVKAAVDFYYGRGKIEQLKKETLHMIAMGFRLLTHLEDYRQGE